MSLLLPISAELMFPERKVIVPRKPHIEFPRGKIERPWEQQRRLIHSGMVVNAFLGSGLPAAPVPDFSHVVLLMGFNGTDASTSFTDESSFARTSTAAGNAQIDTAQQKFGVSSLLLDGTTDAVNLPNNTFSTSGSTGGLLAAWDYQFELWSRFNSNSAVQTFYSRYQASLNNRSMLFQYNGSGTVYFNTYGNGGGTAQVVASASFTPTVGQWYHIACSHVSNRGRLFIDGVKVDDRSHTTNAFTPSSTVPVRIGAQDTSLTNCFNGWIDEARIVTYQSGAPAGKLYTADFAPPTGEFPRS